MITIPLSQLLSRGVRLETVEAVAIVQTLAAGRGVPEIDNVEIDSTGGARCISPRGETTVPGLAALLDRLLPAAGIPAALRYTVARGAGAVEAPPFGSVAEFSRALARFESADPRETIRGLISRARPARPVAPPPPPVVMPQSHPESRPVAPSPPPLVMPQAHPARGVAVLAVTAALLTSAAIGYAGVDFWHSRHPGEDAAPAAVTSAAELSVAPVPPLPEPRGTIGTVPPRRLESGNVASRPSSPVSQPNHGPVGEPVRALPAADSPAFSPAFSSEGTALFFQTGGARDATSAIAVAPLASSPAGDLRIMKIVDDGARNYHAQPSPDGRTIAFDSDRDGERAVYLADSDGTHVRRVSPAGYSALPSWSPDGSRLAYIRAEPDAPSVWNIWVQPIDGRPPVRVTHYRYGQTWAASWFPDGRRIAYSHEDELTILDLGTQRAEHFAAPVRGRLVRTPAVSPDGSRIVFQVFRAGVWMLNVRDGSMECVLADPTAEEFAWAPDGRRFAFHSRRDGEWGVYVLAAG